MLGPVELRTMNGVVDAGPPRQRGVLAALAVDAGRLVTTGMLVERVWGPVPPSSVYRTLYVYVSRIRHVLTNNSVLSERPVQLVRRSGGYLLDVDPDSVDIHRFRRLAEDARDPRHPDARRVALLRQALDLWRGTPLTGLPGQWAARARTGWAQQRVDVITRWADTELRLGNASSTASVLSELSAEHPLAEPLVAALMRALHAAGRGAEALSSYASIRQRLVEELGADPGAELQTLHQELLRGRTNLRSAPPTVGGAPATVPAQLPLGVSGFTGRHHELAHLDALLNATDNDRTAMPVAIVSGGPGVGKTALAVHWAHRVRGRFADGQLYVDLNGSGPANQPALNPVAPLRGFLAALGIDPQLIPTDPSTLAALYRSRLAGLQVLVVLDNARDVEQIRPLLPGSPRCMAVITSRDPMVDLVVDTGTHPLVLDVFTYAEARRMITFRLGLLHVAADSAEIDNIIARCGVRPLALARAAAYAATRSDHRSGGR